MVFPDLFRRGARPSPGEPRKKLTDAERAEVRMQRLERQVQNLNARLETVERLVEDPKAMEEARRELTPAEAQAYYEEIENEI